MGLGNVLIVVIVVVFGCSLVVHAKIRYIVTYTVENSQIVTYTAENTILPTYGLSWYMVLTCVP